MTRNRQKVLGEEVTDGVVAQLEKSPVELELFVKQAAKFFRAGV